jgi:Protein of unknown function (DUF742)
MRHGRDPDPPPRVRPFLGGPRPHEPHRPPGEPAGERTAALRPFVLTAGRVSGADPQIGMETQVTVSPGAAPARLSPEQRAIVALCAQPRSVAEISARLRMHLGVTRILVGDLRAAGQLDVHVLRTDVPDPDTIRRVIRGLRGLS